MAVVWPEHEQTGRTDHWQPEQVGTGPRPATARIVVNRISILVNRISITASPGQCWFLFFFRLAFLEQRTRGNHDQRDNTMPGTTVVILYPYTYHTVYHISGLDALYFGSLCCILGKMGEGS